MRPLFDSYVVVDWSAASVPRQGRDSIWVCRRDGEDGGEIVANLPTRHAARSFLAEQIAQAVAAGRRMLVSFDFPFGYPAGFAARLGLAGSAWRAVWDEIALRIADGPDNRNNRFAVGAEFNRRVSNRAFPFWGCPAGRDDIYLGARHPGAYDDGLDERRLIDGRRYMPGAQPCWKLAYAGSVGGQALTGIPVVRALRDDPRWRGCAAIWPFETGLEAPSGASVVFAEVYPSLWGRRLALPPGEIKDRAQVTTVARDFARRDSAGDLAHLFAGDPGLSQAERRRIEGEEAWALGATAPDRPVASSPAARYSYLRDPAEIYRRSFALIRAEARLDRFPPAVSGLALRLAHAAADGALIDDLDWSPGAVESGRAALAAGAPILVDAGMVEAGIATERLPAGNRVICALHEAEAASLARRLGTTRSAAAVELWRPYLAGAVVAIGNAPTALFHLLEILALGAAKPALILGFPVGFVGAAEAKRALARFAPALAYVTLHGRRGGSALAAAAVNALAGDA